MRFTERTRNDFLKLSWIGQGQLAKEIALFERTNLFFLFVCVLFQYLKQKLRKIQKFLRNILPDKLLEE